MWDFIYGTASGVVGRNAVRDTTEALGENLRGS